ncbi:hypothetical protein [Streptomyces sp. NPDC060322]
MLPTHVMPLAHKGLGTMPTWFVIIVAVPAAIGIGLVLHRARR